MNNLFSMISKLMTGQNQNNDQSQNNNFISDYPDVIFTNKNNFNNATIQNNNANMQNQNNLNFDMLKNFLPLLFGKNSANISNILSADKNNLSQIMSLFTNNKKEENKEHHKQKSEATQMDISEFIEVE